jgi:hypothetical protein
MPIYRVCTWPLDRSRVEAFRKKLAALHAQTFNTDPMAVRVECMANGGEGFNTVVS